MKFASLTLLTGRSTPVITAYINAWFYAKGLSFPTVAEVARIEPEELPYWLRDVDITEITFPQPDQCSAEFA